MDIYELMNGVDYKQIRRGVTDTVTGVCHDSRKSEPGSLYICLKGQRFDGHKFICDAAASGAAAILVQEPQEYYPSGVYVLQTDNTRAAMSLIAANFFGNPSNGVNLIGVTGTKGKTSTSYFISAILEEAGRKAGTVGTVGTMVLDKRIDVPFDTATTPDPLELHKIFYEMKKLGAEDIVMEVSSHALDLDKTTGLDFTVGVFTNLTHDHLDYHITMENYRNAKAKLFKQTSNGVINADDPSSDHMLRHLSEYGRPLTHWLTYGINSECDLQAVHIEYLPEGSSFDIEIDGSVSHFYLPVKGRFNIYNCLAAIGAALELGVPTEVIKRGVSKIKGIPGRIQAVQNDLGAHILVDYAHTPDSIVNIINAVREFTSGKLIIVFGCGGDKDIQKRPMMGRLAGELADHVILTSDNPRSEDPEEIIKQIEAGIVESNSPYEVFVNRRDAIFAGVNKLAEGDSLIIAGKGHENYQIIGDGKIYFDDVETAREALRSRV